MSQFIFTEKSLSEIVRNAVNDAFSQTPKQAVNTRLSDETLYSIAGLADFLDVSYSTAKRLRRSGIIPCTTYGRRIVAFRLADIFRAIETDSRVAKCMARVIEKKMNPVPRVPKPEKAPVIRYCCFLAKGNMFIEIRYIRWKGTYICPVELWDNDDSIKDLVEDIVANRDSYKPFKFFCCGKN